MIRGYPAMFTFAHGALGIEEQPRGSNDGAALRKLLAKTKFKPGDAWCLWFVIAVWIEAGLLGDAPTAWWAESGSCGECLHGARTREKVLPYPASGALALVVNDEGIPHHAVWIHSVSSDGQTVTTIEGNSNNDGSFNGYEVVVHIRHVSTLIFIQP